ncbi:MAG: hypothetical protein QXJ75_02205 [Candidatus Bathyarchaeia archaeon]
MHGEKPIYLSEEEYEKLIEAKKLYEVDTGEEISLGGFVSLLTLTYMVFREKRGKAESIYLKELNNRLK